MSPAARFVSDGCTVCRWIWMGAALDLLGSTLLSPPSTACTARTGRMRTATGAKMASSRKITMVSRTFPTLCLLLLSHYHDDRNAVTEMCWRRIHVADHMSATRGLVAKCQTVQSEKGLRLTERAWLMQMTSHSASMRRGTSDKKLTTAIFHWGWSTN